MSGQRIYMGQLCQLIDRRPATVRDWERRDVLPHHLRGHRDKPNGKRWWVQEQVDGILAWMKANDVRPGKGLPHYRPTPAKIHEHLEGQRLPRKGERAVAARSGA